MSILRDVQKLLTVIEGLYPRAKYSALYRVASKRAIKSAALAETEWQDSDTIGATRDGSLEDEQCQDPGNQEASTTALNRTLTELLRKPPPNICRASTERPARKSVRLIRSTRLPRT